MIFTVNKAKQEHLYCTLQNPKHMRTKQLGQSSLKGGLGSELVAALGLDMRNMGQSKAKVVVLQCVCHSFIIQGMNRPL